MVFFLLLFLGFDNRKKAIAMQLHVFVCEEKKRATHVKPMQMKISSQSIAASSFLFDCWMKFVHIQTYISVMVRLLLLFCFIRSTFDAFRLAMCIRHNWNIQCISIDFDHFICRRLLLFLVFVEKFPDMTVLPTEWARNLCLSFSHIANKDILVGVVVIGGRGFDDVEHVNVPDFRRFV